MSTTQNKPPTSTPSSTTTAQPIVVLDVVFTKIKHALQAIADTDNYNNEPASTETSIASQIVTFLNNEYNLYSNHYHQQQQQQFALQDFLSQDKPEILSCAQAHLALTTQISASHLMLHANLAQTSLEELVRDIEITKAFVKLEYSRTSHLSYYTKAYVEPLSRQIGDLKDKLKHADEQSQAAQLRAMEMRIDAAKPVMRKLNQCNKEYIRLFAPLDFESLQYQVQTINSLLQTSTISTQLQVFDSATAATAATAAASILQPAVRQVLCNAHSHAPVAETNTLEYLKILYRDGQKCVRVFLLVMQELQRRCDDKNIKLDIKIDIKAVKDAIEKTAFEHEGDFSLLLDLVHGKVICDDVSDIPTVVETVADMVKQYTRIDDNINDIDDDNISKSRRPYNTYQDTIHLASTELISVVNNIDSRPFYDVKQQPEGAKSQNILLNLRVDQAHVCEMKITAKPFDVLESSLEYKETVTLLKSLQLNDCELENVRLCATSGSNTIAATDSVREELEAALKRLEGGMCHSLQLINFKLTLAECEALRNAMQSPSSHINEMNLLFCGLNKEKSVVLSSSMSTHTNDKHTINPNYNENNNIINNDSSNKPIEYFGEIRFVNVQGNKGIGGNCLAKFVSHSLEKLSAKSCDIGPDDCQEIAEALLQRKPLKISELNFLDNEIGAQGMKHLAMALAHLHSLTALDLAANRLGPEGAQHVASAIANMPNLTSLDLSANGFGPEGADHLAEALRNIDTITCLQLGANYLGPEGAESIREALANMRFMTSLNFWRNRLGPEGVKHIAAAISDMSNMTLLELSSNDMGPEGAQHVASAIANMPNLTTLDLSDNKIEYEGASHVTQALTNHRSIATMNVQTNRLGNEGARCIVNAVAKMPQFTCLDMWYNHLDDDTMQWVKDQLRHVGAVIM